MTQSFGFCHCISLWDPEAAEKVGSQNAHHCQWPLVRSGVNLQPLGEVVWQSRCIGFSPHDLRKGPCEVDGDPLEWCCDILVDQAPISRDLGLLPKCHIVRMTSHYPSCS